MKENNLKLYDSLSKIKKKFESIIPGKVGMYVCGPTVYGEPHLGHARSSITFDILFRYLKHLGYKVRYVRNITDVGHLENDSDDGEDKIQKKATLENLEPMEVAQHYLNLYHESMKKLNVLPPSIEPFASGHILEQIEYIKQILNAGYAYESNGSVYFDIQKYSKDYNYGRLSRRKIDESLEGTRNLNGTEEKRSSLDFALWKKADPGHIMKWPSPWSIGFPGWHLECSVMGQKYLGEQFDIHGGGLDLLFPHHECEMAQSEVVTGKDPARYWIHNNMITIDGKKMGKSYGNFITLNQFFSGDSPLLSESYSPMVIRFFILQTGYRTPLDFSDKSLKSSKEGLEKLVDSYKRLLKISPKGSYNLPTVSRLFKDAYRAMDDDLSTPQVISLLFDASSIINDSYYKGTDLSEEDINTLKDFYKTFLEEILGIDLEVREDKYTKAVDFLLDIRNSARKNKDWATSDIIRDRLEQLGFELKDGRDGKTEWKIK